MKQILKLITWKAKTRKVEDEKKGKCNKACKTNVSNWHMFRRKNIRGRVERVLQMQVVQNLVPERIGSVFS